MWDEQVDREIAARVGVMRAGSSVKGLPSARLRSVQRPRRIEVAGLLGDLLVWGVLALSVMILALAVIARTSSRSGMQWLVVVSNSMKPALSTGDLVAVRPVAAGQLRVGDIITFEDFRGSAVLVTHRIVEIMPSGSGRAFRVKGDNNSVLDPDPVNADQVMGKVVFHLPLAGYVVHALQQRPALALLALLPSILLMTLQGLRRLTISEAEVRSP